MHHQLRVRRLYSAAGSSLVLLLAGTVVTGLAGVGSASAAPPPRPDLVVEVTVDPAELPAAGGLVRAEILVRNVGSGSADDVTVKIRPPAGSTLAGEGEVPPLPLAMAEAEEPSSGWQCDYTEWRCTYGTLAAGRQAQAFGVPLRLPAERVGDTATVSVTVSTSSHETATDNNTNKAKVVYTAVADLAVELLGEGWSDVSNLGGRAYVQARVTNVGTAPVSDVHFTIEPPPGTWLQAENFDPSGEFDCDISGAPWTCTRGTLGPDAIAYLNIPLMFPGGTSGDTMTMTARASTTTTERSLANNSDEFTFRYITPTPAEVTISGMSAYPQQVLAGDQVTIWIQVDNIGGSPADNVTVRLALPDTVEPMSADGSGADWSCSVAAAEAEGSQRVWSCVHERYEPQGLELVAPIELVATVGAGTPDGTLTFAATVQTESPEQSTDNNFGEATTTYVAQGKISGHVWLDQDRDGQRDADEPAIGSGSDGVGRLLFLADGTVGIPWDTPMATVNPNGTYVQRLAPGRYLVRVEVSPALDFTTPNTGDDGTDSDVVFKTRLYDTMVAESAVVDVTDGGDTAVDIGLVPAEQPPG
jgi:hypothetical protein